MFTADTLLWFLTDINQETTNTKVFAGYTTYRYTVTNKKKLEKLIYFFQVYTTLVQGLAVIRLLFVLKVCKTLIQIVVNSATLHHNVCLYCFPFIFIILGGPITFTLQELTQKLHIFLFTLSYRYMLIWCVLCGHLRSNVINYKLGLLVG